MSTRGLEARTELERDLRVALAEDELHVAYQPIVDLEQGGIRGVEGLVRWQNRSRGLVPPAAFLPVAERDGLIVDIGNFVLEQACRDGRRWRDAFGPHFRMSVNASARQLRQPGFAAAVEEALAAADLEPEGLMIEVTERILREHEDGSGAVLAELRELGVRLAIDNFGTETTSLGDIGETPIDAVKIDRSIIDGLSDPNEVAVVRAIVEDAREHGIHTVAGGVQRMSQLPPLRKVGCALAQGRLFGRPGHPAAIDALIGAESLIVGAVAMRI